MSSNINLRFIVEQIFLDNNFTSPCFWNHTDLGTADNWQYLAECFLYLLFGSANLHGIQLTCAPCSHHILCLKEGLSVREKRSILDTHQNTPQLEYTVVIYCLTERIIDSIWPQGKIFYGYQHCNCKHTIQQQIVNTK